MVHWLVKIPLYASFLSAAAILGLAVSLFYCQSLVVFFKRYLRPCFQYLFSRFVIVSMLPLLSGCHAVLLDPQGPIATDEKHILIATTLLMSLVVVPVILLTLFFAWRYRASNTKAAYSPGWAHSTSLEVTWWSVSSVIIAVLAIITWISTHQLDPYEPLAVKEKPLTIQAVALNWKWLFIYPEQHIATINFVQFPVGVPINFLITAEGPMNSFQIPQLAGQIYAMAGMQTKLHVLASKAGDYRGLSTNFSGEGFSDMKFIARASSLEQFDQWIKKVKTSPQDLTARTYQQLTKDSINHPVEYYSSISPDLFNDIIMKSMMPMPTPRQHKSERFSLEPPSK